MTNYNAFWAKEDNLVLLNRQALLNQVFSFFYDDDSDFDFPGFSSAFFRVYNEREDLLLKNYTTQVTRSSNDLIFNCSVSDMTFNDLGKYWYEMGYVRSGGYEIILRFGKVTVI